MRGIRSIEALSVMPLIEPHAITATVHRSVYIDCNYANWAGFLVNFGTVTTGAGATCDGLTITVEGSSIQTSAGATEIPFVYRLSSAMGTDSWGTITAGTSDGVTLTSSDLGNAVLNVGVDPAVLPGRGEKYRFITLVLTPTSTTAITCGVLGYVEPRYPGNSQLSSS